MYKRDKKLSSERKLKFAEYPAAYELRLIDDDESFYHPFYEIAPLDIKENIGDFESLAFVEVKTFKPPNQVKEQSSNAEDSQKKLEGILSNESKRLLMVEVNTTLLKTKSKLVLNEED